MSLKQDNPYYREFYQKQGTAVQGTWVWGAGAGQTNFASVTGEVPGTYYNSLHNDLDEYKWANIFLTKGSYKITVVYDSAASSGIGEVLLGTVSLGTYDMYTAVLTPNRVWEITFTLISDQTADVRYRCNGKNPLSTNHYVSFSRFWIEKTG